MTIESRGQPELKESNDHERGVGKKTDGEQKLSVGASIALALKGQTSGQTDEPAGNGGSNKCDGWDSSVAPPWISRAAE
jgi:hypothetical protein